MCSLLLLKRGLGSKGMFVVIERNIIRNDKQYVKKICTFAHCHFHFTVAIVYVSQ